MILNISQSCVWKFLIIDTSMDSGYKKPAGTSGTDLEILGVPPTCRHNRLHLVEPLHERLHRQDNHRFRLPRHRAGLE